MRRASYVAPLRLYLIFSILAFAIPSITPDTSPSQVKFSVGTPSQSIPAGGSGIVGDLVMLPVWALLAMLLLAVLDPLGLA